MSGLAAQVRSVVDTWPSGGYVVGILPDLSDPEWSGRAVLRLAEAAGEGRGPSVVLDLAPDGTDLTSRFDVTGGPGFADLAAGDTELWEITRRSDLHDVLYLPQGFQGSGADLVASPATRKLAEQIRGKGRALLIIVDPLAAEDAETAGWLDGLVRLGETDPEESGWPGDLPELGRLTRDAPARTAAAGESTPRTTGRPAEARQGTRPSVVDGESRTGARVALPPDLASPWRRVRRGAGLLALVALLLAVGLTVSPFLGGPGWRAAEEVAVTAATDVADFIRPTPDRSGIASAEPADRGRDEGTGGGAGPDRSDSPGDSAPAVAGTEGRVGAADVPGSSAGEEQATGTESGGGTPTDVDSPPSGTSPGSVPTRPAPSSTSSGGETTDRGLPTPPGSEDLAAFRAISDSLDRSIQAYYLQRDRYMEADAGCPELGEAYARADRLFESLWLYRMSLQSELDSAARSSYRSLAREIEGLTRSFETIGCPPP